MSANSQNDDITLYSWFRLEKALKSFIRQRLKTLPHWAIKRGFKTKEELHQAYVDRLVYEFEIIRQMGFLGYFLIVADLIQFCRHEGIPTGPARGSAAGALISFLLQITKVDPIKYDLLFERFMNPDRISMPDVDLDISQNLRHLAKDYLAHKFGRDHVASIGTFSRMKVRAAIKDVVRSLNLGGNPGETFRLADRISKTLDDEDPDVTYSEALKNEEFKGYMDKYPVVANHIRLCENILRQMSMHAAGVLISAKPLDEELPLIVDKKGMVLTAYDGGTCENLGYLKLDTLGLKNLDVIATCRDNIKKTRGKVPRMELDGIDVAPNEDPKYVSHKIENLEDEGLRLASKAYEFLRGTGSTLGIFQCEQSVTQSLLRKGRTNSIENIADILALIRPGPRKAGSTNVYLARKREEEKISYVYEQTHEYDPTTGTYSGEELEEPIVHDLNCLAPICDGTQGLPLFQEQIMKISTRIAAFTVGESDVLRKAVGKKDAELIRKTGEKLIKGLVGGGAELNKEGLPKHTAEFLWYKFILPYGSYGFNLSHSISYALISYETAWLKANFPAEFYAALLSYENDQEKINTIIGEAKAVGIQFLPPNINKSTNNFTIVDEETIVYSLTCMKGVGDKQVEKITSKRPYTSMIDFIGRSGVNSAVTQTLIKGGAFEGVFEEEISRKNYYDFFKDCKTKLKRQIDRLLRESLGKQFNYIALKGEAKKAAQAAGTHETPAQFHKRMLETDKDYQEAYQKGSLEEIAKFEYDWTGPFTFTSKGVAKVVPRMSEDERSKWTPEEKFDFEDEIFGTVLSGHRLDPYRVFEENFLQNLERSDLPVHKLTSDLAIYEPDEEVYIYCQGLRLLRKSAYKKDPKKYTRYFEIEDRYGKARITCFDQSFKFQLSKSKMNPLSIMAKKLPYRPVMAIKCKVNEYMGNRSLVLDTVIDWVNEEDIKTQFREDKKREMS